MTARDLSSIQLGPESHLRLNGLQQLATASQTRAIAQSLKHLAKKHGKQSFELNKLLIDLDGAWSDERHGGGLDVLGEEGWGPDGFLARPRRFEVGMAINRLVSVINLYMTHKISAGADSWSCQCSREMYTLRDI